MPRYFAGDKSLIEEIIKISESTESAAVMAQQELDIDSDDDGFALEQARATKLLKAELAVREGQVLLQKQQVVLATKQAALVDRQAALLSRKFPHSEENSQKLQKIRTGMAEQLLVKMQIDSIARTKKLVKDIDAELLAISTSGVDETDKAQAMDRVRALYGHLSTTANLNHWSPIGLWPIGRTPAKQLLDFLLAFLDTARAGDPGSSVCTTIIASKFNQAYLLFETVQKPPIRMSVTMFLQGNPRYPRLQTVRASPSAAAPVDGPTPSIIPSSCAELPRKIHATTSAAPKARLTGATQQPALSTN